MDLFKKRMILTLNNASIVNIISSFIAGALIPLEINHSNFYVLIYIGFLGSFSTFSSFIFELFKFLRRNNYIEFFQHYLEVIIFSLFAFVIGYFSFKLIIY